MAAPLVYRDGSAVEASAGEGLLCEGMKPLPPETSGGVELNRTRSRICITPLLVRKSVLTMLAVTPFSVTLHDKSLGSCTKV